MIPWGEVETVLLDMDGTLLDLYFDNHFWLEYLPQQYADKHRMAAAQAQQVLQEKYQAVTGTLDWYCLDYWCAELDLDIVALKREIGHLIQLRPSAEVFLKALHSSGRDVMMVTNAHRQSLELKMEKTALSGYFNQLVSSHDFKLPKEAPGFWKQLQTFRHFRPEKTLLIDDNESVLESAREFGIVFLLSIEEPDLRAGKRKDASSFPRMGHFAQMLPIPAL